MAISTGRVASQFPPSIERLFRPLWNEIVWLNAKWNAFTRLYGTDEATVELLNHVAGSFFRLVEESLRDDVLLSIGRLLDPSATGAKANLSLQALLDGVDAQVEPELRQRLIDALDRLRSHCEGITARRNRKLAHTDLPTALNKHLDDLPGISLTAVRDAIEQVNAFMNLIDIHFRENTTFYDSVIERGDAGSLVTHLKRARQHEDCERREFEAKYGVRRE